MRTTLQDLQEINLNATTLSEGMTDRAWQDYFARMKMIVQPVKAKTMGGVSSLRLSEGEEYQGDTIAMSYKKFINDTLHDIRIGEICYCFYIYQIAELLKYEHSLKATYLPEYECFEVSL